MSSLPVQLIAHRGWSNAFPENSLAALAAAITAGANEIEFDVRVSKDLVPFLCHDENTSRVSNLNSQCSLLTIKDLKEACIYMPDGSLVELGFTLLEDVFAAFGGFICMNIHIKDSNNVNIVLDCIQKKMYSSIEKNLLYIAAAPEILEIALSRYGNIPRCCLDATKNPNHLLTNAKKYRCQRLQFRRNLYTKDHIKEALNANFIPNLFYADTPDEAEKAIENGIIGLLTNDIGPIRKHLIQKKIIKT